MGLNIVSTQSLHSSHGWDTIHSKYWQWFAMLVTEASLFLLINLLFCWVRRRESVIKIDKPDPRKLKPGEIFLNFIIQPAVLFFSLCFSEMLLQTGVLFWLAAETQAYRYYRVYVHDWHPFLGGGWLFGWSFMKLKYQENYPISHKIQVKYLEYASLNQPEYPVILDRQYPCLQTHARYGVIDIHII